MVALTVREVIRGNPPSSVHQVDPVQLERLLVEIQAQAALTGPMYFVDDLASLEVIAADDDAVGFVLAGADAGTYRSIGGVWTKAAALPDGLSGYDHAVLEATITALQDSSSDQGARIVVLEEASADYAARLAALEVITIDNLSIAGGAIYELGLSITPTLNWVLGGTGTPTAQSIDGQSIPPGTQSYTPAAPITADKTYTLAVTDASGRVVQSSVTVDFRNRAFWGAANAAALDSAGVIALSASALATARGRTMTVTPAGEQYVFYAYPAAWGAPAQVTAFGFPTDVVTTVVSVTTAAGWTENYNVVRLAQKQAAAVPLVVS